MTSLAQVASLGTGTASAAQVIGQLFVVPHKTTINRIIKLLERTYKKQCAGGKISEETCIMAPEEFDFVERTMIRMGANKLLDREMWMERIKKAQEFRNNMPLWQVGLAILCTIVLIILVIRLLFAISDLPDGMMTQVIYAWFLVILMKLASIYL